MTMHAHASWKYKDMYVHAWSCINRRLAKKLKSRKMHDKTSPCMSMYVHSWSCVNKSLEKKLKSRKMHDKAWSCMSIYVHACSSRNKSFAKNQSLGKYMKRPCISMHGYAIIKV